MKMNLSLKLAIGIIATFAILICGFLFYESIWIKWQEHRLCSPDEATRIDAALTVASGDKRALPYVKSWLMTGSDRLVRGACLVLDAMEGDLWEGASRELTYVLSGRMSDKTNIVSGFMFRNGYAIKWGRGRETKWLKFRDSVDAKRNICMYMLSLKSDIDFRHEVAILLGELGDGRALPMLFDAVENSSDTGVRARAVSAFRHFSNPRVISVLCNVFLNDNVNEVRGMAACVLIVTGEKSAIKVLISALHDIDPAVRYYSTYALDQIEHLHGFPGYDFSADRITRRKQAKAIEEWYEKNNSRLKWDKKAEKYYLTDL